jgi:hypothetical protein
MFIIITLPYFFFQRSSNLILFDSFFSIIFYFFIWYKKYILLLLILLYKSLFSVICFSRMSHETTPLKTWKLSVKIELLPFVYRVKRFNFNKQNSKFNTHADMPYRKKYEIVGINIKYNKNEHSNTAFTSLYKCVFHLKLFKFNNTVVA